MNKEYLQMINILSYYKVIKLRISLKNETNLLDTMFRGYNYSKSDYANFIMFLYDNQYLETYDDIDKNLLYDTDNLSALINWNNIYKDELIVKCGEMYDLVTKNKEAYNIMYSRSKFLSMLDYYRYVEPSNIISRLDQLFIISLIKEDEKLLEADVVWEDIYSNLLIYYWSLPFKKESIYNYSSYYILIKDLYGVDISDKELKMIEIETFVKSQRLENKSEFLDQEDLIVK